MKETFLSFYLRTNRIQVFVSALKGIGNPRRICFLLSRDGKSLLLTPYGKRDLKSHSVPASAYQGSGDFRINSYKLCHILAEKHHWDLSRSYRVPGKVCPKRQIVVFDLTSARVLDHVG